MKNEKKNNNVKSISTKESNSDWATICFRSSRLHIFFTFFSFLASLINDTCKYIRFYWTFQNFFCSFVRSFVRSLQLWCQVYVYFIDFSIWACIQSFWGHMRRHSIVQKILPNPQEQQQQQKQKTKKKIQATGRKTLVAVHFKSCQLLHGLTIKSSTRIKKQNKKLIL